jgi:hypothetical protein
MYRLPMPGAPALSFGITMHKTFNKFSQALKQQTNHVQADLFGTRPDKIEVPPFSVLEKFYLEAWIDDWYESKANKEEYRATGKRYLKNFYDKTLAEPKVSKYLEYPFRMNLGNYKFKGRIDRADENLDGTLDIVDYKTGQPRSKLEQVDKDQLLIYQWATQESLKQKVNKLTYWYLEDLNNLLPFKGEEEEIEKLKEKLTATIEEIVHVISTNSFYEADLRHAHDCKYRHLERH